MLCRRCSTLVEQAGGPGLVPQAGPLSAGPAPVDRLCVGCGALLAPAGRTARLLAKLAQLARFGLGGRTRPLLKGGDAADGEDP